MPDIVEEDDDEAEGETSPGKMTDLDDLKQVCNSFLFQYRMHIWRTLIFSKDILKKVGDLLIGTRTKNTLMR
jgi:hypothetical protein